ncbi:MAG: sulfotransferase family protein, partial [Pseudomonadota bacterium]
ELFTHSFLIRDPAKSIPSIYSRAPEWKREEFGYREHRALFDLVTDWQGFVPPVIDSDDLLEDPPRVVSAWCEAVGIPFLPEALTWEPGARDEVSWYDDGSWHDKLAQSSGLTPQPRTYGKIDEAGPAVREIYDDALPHYLHLHGQRVPAS